MVIDKLVKGHPYLYLDADGQSNKVLFHRATRLNDGSVGYVFNQRIGFVTLTRR